MASNGFMRDCCYRCIFHEDDQDFRDICLLNDSDNEDSEFVFDRLKWISTNDCDRSDYCIINIMRSVSISLIFIN